MKRMQKKRIINDLDRKMVFLVGPRQAGKTWLAKDVLSEYEAGVYLNYDQVVDRKIIHNQAWLPSTQLLVLDELHKMPDWKNYLKGLYDTKSEHTKILVTGSARLDIFNQVGDSLAGRYFQHRLMPLCPGELYKLGEKPNINKLMQRGGFPEPFLASKNVDAERWRMQYISSLINVDVLDFDGIQNLAAIKLILELLRRRVGLPISYQSISEDVDISPNTVKKYIKVLEALYIVFRVTPFSKNIARSILKEPKIYFFDTGLVVGDKGVIFENIVALSLLTHIYTQIDYQAKNYSLHYLRTKEGKEIDFALTCDEMLEQIIEVKYADGKPSSSLIAFHEKYQIPAIQLVKELVREQVISGVEIREATNYLKELFVVEDDR